MDEVAALVGTSFQVKVPLDTSSDCKAARLRLNLWCRGPTGTQCHQTPGSGWTRPSSALTQGMKQLKLSLKLT